MEVGQEVRVLDVNGARSGMPKGGWVGVVTKVGRKLFTVDYPDAGWVHYNVRGIIFRLEDLHWNNKDFGYQKWVVTLERAALNERTSKAAEALDNHGLEIKRTCKLTIEQLEAVVRVLEGAS